MIRRTLLYVCFFTILLGVPLSRLSAELNYTIIPENPRPGEPVTIAVDSALKQAVLTRGDRQFARSMFFAITAEIGRPGFMAAILTVPSTVNPGAAVIQLETDWGSFYEVPIRIAGRDFRSETIALTPALTGIRTDASPQRAVEVDRLWSILAATGSEVFHTGRFVPPVTSTRRTSAFGSRRVFEYSDGRTDTSIHAGVDYGVPTGTEVAASGKGRVVLAVSRITTGLSVIIEHAPGVYSIYYHLDSIAVEEGSMVEIGQLIGLSGSTGVSTGPHLHWELRINTENTDPDAFLARPIIDKDLILSRLYNID